MSPEMQAGIEVRMARLEGAFEQIDKRLAVLESRFLALEARMESPFQALEDRIQTQFYWLLGVILTTWITLLLAIFFKS